MSSIEHTETTTSPEGVWDLWSDVASWPAWDSGVEKAVIDGPFAAGSRGSLQPVAGPRVKYRITELRPGASFVNVSRLPLCRVEFAHELKPLDAGRASVTHRVTFKGPLAPLFRLVIGKDLQRDLPKTVRALVRMAEASR